MKLYLGTNAITKIGHKFVKTQYVKVAKICTEQGYSVVMHEVEAKITEQLVGDIDSA